MEIIYGVSMFILIITLLVMIILFAKNLLIPSGDIEINVNNDKDKSFKTSPGSKLLSILSDKDIENFDDLSLFKRTEKSRTDIVHRTLLKYVLGVSKTCHNIAIYGETGEIG